MNNIDWPLFHRQKQFLLELAGDAANEQDEAMLYGIINLMDAIQDEHERSSTCEACGNEVPEIVGCPNGREVCQACFDLGAEELS